MNKVNAEHSSSKDDTMKSRSLTPAILGVPKSHGIKLSLMTSEDRKELMQKVEEWRKAKNEKLAAKIFAKQKLVEKPKLSVNLNKKSVTSSSGGILKSQDKESVFERLYKSNGKFKTPQVSDTFNEIEAGSIQKPISVAGSKPLKFSESCPIPDENSKPSDFSAAENVKNFTYSLCSSEASTGAVDAKVEKAIEQPAKATDSIYKVVPQITKPKYPKPEPLMSKSTLIKKPEINKSSKFTEVATKNLPPKIGDKVSTKKMRPPLRRSISMLFRQKNKTKNFIRKSVSAKNLHEWQLDKKESTDDNVINPKIETITKSVPIATPKTKQFSSTHLRSKLEDWLKVNGHTLDGYRHLRCFGINDMSISLPPIVSVQSENSLENPNFSSPPKTPSDESNKENVTPVASQVDVTQAENWLKELRLLISNVKYPSDRCEEWLTAIRKKYPKCSQLPIYWECLAALNECKGDIKSAIEDYERAIITGGQVDSVGNSLAQLFDKMVIEQRKPVKTKIEKGIDPKNIFKSTIIKFALQQKTLRKLGPQIDPGVREQLYIATPVRRSSRIQTPLKMKEVASLETLTPDVKRNLTFKPNESLLETD